MSGQMDVLMPVRRFWEDVWTQGRAELLRDLFAEHAIENGEQLDIEAFG